jgi:guanosine-3',5'-bis(diphosphate) 3'-pyrophosphohydrolase
MEEQNTVTAILKALHFAAVKHRDQRRKDAEASPYINHPIALADVLVNEGGVRDAAVICAAVLHDTIEDTETTPQELSREFGRIVCDVVLEVTDDKRLPKAERKRRQVASAADASDAAKLVKLADKICNVRDVASHPPQKWSLRRRQKYFDWAAQVVDRLRGVHPALEAVFDAACALRPRSGYAPSVINARTSAIARAPRARRAAPARRR